MHRDLRRMFMKTFFRICKIENLSCLRYKQITKWNINKKASATEKNYVQIIQKRL